jgi:hypothetical protein
MVEGLAVVADGPDDNLICGDPDVEEVVAGKGGSREAPPPRRPQMGRRARDHVGDPVDGSRSLIVVLVASKDDIHAVALEDGPQCPSNLPRRSVPAGRVRRMMESDDAKGGIVSGQRLLEPGSLLAVAGAGRVERHQLEGAEPALVPARRHAEAASNLVTLSSIDVVVPQDGAEDDAS